MHDMIFNLAASILLVYIFIERIRSTFVNKDVYTKEFTPLEDNLCRVMIALYISILLTAFITYVFTAPEHKDLLTSIFGLFVWVCGVKLRSTSITAMGRSWCIYRTPKHLKRLCTLGPYDYSRHPYYWASIVELVSYGLIFNSYLSIVMTILLYLPLIIMRSLHEERLLRLKFHSDYIEYAAKTHYLISMSKLLNNMRSLNHIRQIVRICRIYGPSQLIKIIFMNRAVKTYFRNYIISQCITCLSETKVIDHLLEKKVLNINTYAKENHLNFRVLRTICDYLYVNRILKKNMLTYSLTDYGLKLVKTARGVFDFIDAYSPVFNNLSPLLKNDLDYGKDLQRKGASTGRASAELAELFPFPVARSFLKKYKCSRILDIGSGSGDFLIGFCKDPNVYGFGVDLSSDAVHYANDKAELNNVSQRVKFTQGDALKLDDWKSNYNSANIDIVTCMFVLHEFLAIDDSLVINMLKGIKSSFPDKYILITELTRCDLNHLYKNPSGVVEHHFFHSLSNQGLASSQEWRNLFSKAGLELVQEERLDLAEQSIFLLR